MLKYEPKASRERVQSFTSIGRESDGTDGSLRYRKEAVSSLALTKKEDASKAS